MKYNLIPKCIAILTTMTFSPIYSYAGECVDTLEECSLESNGTGGDRGTCTRREGTGSYFGEGSSSSTSQYAATGMSCGYLEHLNSFECGAKSAAISMDCPPDPDPNPGE